MVNNRKIVNKWHQIISTDSRQMREISQRLQVNKNLTAPLYLISDKTHILEVELVLEAQTNSVLTAVQIMLETIQVTSYLLEVKTSKTRVIRFDLIISKSILRIKINHKFKWLLLQAIKFQSRLPNMEEIILILMVILGFKDNRIFWKIKNFLPQNQQSLINMQLLF